MNRTSTLIFWVATTVFLTLTFGQANGDYVESFFFVSFLLPVAVGTSFYFNQYLVPRYLLTKSYMKFGLYLLYSVIFSLYLEMLVLTAALILLANYNISEMHPYSTNVLLLSFTLYLIVFLQAFIILLRKYQTGEHRISVLEDAQKKSQLQQIVVKSERKHVKINLEKIQYIESLADYVKIITPDRQVITKEKISVLESRLPENFIRVHRSFLVNLNYVQTFTNDQIKMNITDIPISRTYKKSVIERLNKASSLI